MALIPVLLINCFHKRPYVKGTPWQYQTYHNTCRYFIQLDWHWKCHYIVPRYSINSFLFEKFIKKRYHILLNDDRVRTHVSEMMDCPSPVHWTHWQRRPVHSPVWFGYTTLLRSLLSNSFFATQILHMCIWLTRCNLTQFHNFFYKTTLANYAKAYSSTFDTRTT